MSTWPQNVLELLRSGDESIAIQEIADAPSENDLDALEDLLAAASDLSASLRHRMHRVIEARRTHLVMLRQMKSQSLSQSPTPDAPRPQTPPSSPSSKRSP